jgi:hypothetical protein
LLLIKAESNKLRLVAKSKQENAPRPSIAHLHHDVMASVATASDTVSTPQQFWAFT